MDFLFLMEYMLWFDVIGDMLFGDQLIGDKLFSDCSLSLSMNQIAFDQTAFCQIGWCSDRFCFDRYAAFWVSLRGHGLLVMFSLDMLYEREYALKCSVFIIGTNWMDWGHSIIDSGECTISWWFRFKMARIGSLCGLHQNKTIRWYSVVWCWWLRVIGGSENSLEVDISVEDDAGEMLSCWVKFSPS